MHIRGVDYPANWAFCASPSPFSFSLMDYTVLSESMKAVRILLTQTADERGRGWGYKGDLTSGSWLL